MTTALNKQQLYPGRREHLISRSSTLQYSTCKILQKSYKAERGKVWLTYKKPSLKKPRHWTCWTKTFTALNMLETLKDN